MKYILSIILLFVSCSRSSTSLNDNLWIAQKENKKLYFYEAPHIENINKLPNKLKTFLSSVDSVFLETSILDRINVLDELNKRITQHQPNYIVKNHLQQKEWSHFKKAFLSPSIVKEMKAYGKDVSIDNISSPYAMFLLLRASIRIGNTSFLPAYAIEKLQKSPKGTRHITYKAQVNMKSLVSKIESVAEESSKYPKSLVSIHDQKKVALSNFSFSNERSLDFIKFLFIKKHPLLKRNIIPSPLYKRTNWLTKILKQSKYSPSIFIAVEMGHLEGREGLLQGVKSAGYKVSKIRTK